MSRSRVKPLLGTMLRPGLIAAAALLLAGTALEALPSIAQEVKAIPAPAKDEPSGRTATETAVFAGGCFWGVQGVFQHVVGVSKAVSGYAGGDADTAQYEEVATGTTGHAESVRVTYDPSKVTYGKLLQVYFSVAHDPTELNFQGPDTGTQYRSAIFPVNDEQADLAKAYIAQLNQAHLFSAAIVTKIEPGHEFYPAEGYHQDFLENNPTYPYIAINDLPKVAALQRLYPDLYRSEPVLVASAGAAD